MSQFEIYQDASDEYRWRFRASNGKIVADSAEGYTHRRDCERGIEIVRTDAPNAAIQNVLDAG